MDTLLAIIQIILSILLIITILLQNSESGLGSAFGGGDGAIKTTRRGAEKIIFQATIIIAIVFVIVSFIVFAIS
jgi:preprotein translocase subunit SecG